MFEYYAVMIDSLFNLQMELRSRGAKGWRLHTCESSSVGYFIVMDRFIANDAESGNNEEKDEAMACKG